MERGSGKVGRVQTKQAVLGVFIFTTLTKGENINFFFFFEGGGGGGGYQRKSNLIRFVV